MVRPHALLMIVMKTNSLKWMVRAQIVKSIHTLLKIDIHAPQIHAREESTLTIMVTVSNANHLQSQARP